MLSEEDKKFIKDQLTGQVLINSGDNTKNKIKSVIFDIRTVSLVFGRVKEPLNIGPEVALLLAENGKIGQYVLEGFEKEKEKEQLEFEEEIQKEDDLNLVEIKSEDDLNLEGINLGEDDLPKTMTDQDYKNELDEMLTEEGIIGYTNRIHEIMTGEDDKFGPEDIQMYLDDPDGNGFGIFGYDRKIKGIYEDYPYKKEEENEEEDIVENIDIELVSAIDDALKYNFEQNGGNIQVLFLLKAAGITLDEWYYITIKDFKLLLQNHTVHNKEFMIKSLRNYVNGITDAMEGDDLDEGERDFIKLLFRNTLEDGKISAEEVSFIQSISKKLNI